MYSVEELEQQWRRYRRKKIISPVLVSLFVLAGIATAVYFIDMNKGVLENNASVLAAAGGAQKSLSVENREGMHKKRAVGKLDVLSTEVPSLSTGQNEDHPKAGQIIFQDVNAEPGNKVKKRKNVLIQVTERGGKSIATDVENRFEFAKDKSDSLFLAKYYYDKMEYKKSEKWALETNKLDNTIEESWLVFAKSLAKQGKRAESLKVLKAFLDQGDSMEAESLMDKIRRGKSF